MEEETVVEFARSPRVAHVVDQPSPGGTATTARVAHNDSPFEQTRRQAKRVEIDMRRLADLGYVTPDAPRNRLADEYRVIKRPLLTNALRKGGGGVERGNLILITSAMPGEGKTFTSINLALSMAVELDCTVLLVDADVARPAILNRLGLPATKGLLDVLTDQSLEVGDVLMRTNVDRLAILPAGTHHPRATELLASDGMTRLVDELATRYADRILVFDAPPLLPSTESRVLASHMGQIVVVVEADRTQRSTLTQALATVESCPIVMTLLNKVASSEVGSYYGYYSNAPA
jgi:receptor protein-tyrosine kinase